MSERGERGDEGKERVGWERVRKRYKGGKKRERNRGHEVAS